jgi:hypothetical protein
MGGENPIRAVLHLAASLQSASWALSDGNPGGGSRVSGRLAGSPAIARAFEALGPPRGMVAAPARII